MKKFLAAVILISCSALATFAQTKTFKWDTELCAHEGDYNSAKYTEAQLKDTQQLVSILGWIPLFTDATAGTYDEIGSLSIVKLDKEYKEQSAKLKSLRVIKSDYFEKLRKKKLAELDQYYQLSKITIEGYENPAALKKLESASFCVDFYAGPLIAGGDYLYATWLKVNMDSRSKNSSPGRLKREFDVQNASPDRLKYALVEVMRFGWWNCALRSVDQFDSEVQTKANEEFNKLFTNLKEECDEPE